MPPCMSSESSALAGETHVLPSHKRLDEDAEAARLAPPTRAPRLSRAARAPNGGDVVGPHLVNTKIRYEDPQSGLVAEFIVKCCGQNRLGKTWFEVQYTNGEQPEERYSQEEMREILTCRVP